MKKVLLLALPVLAAALFIPAAFAGNSPAPKATGDFWYDNLSGGNAHFVFNAQDLGANGAKGSVSFDDPTWGSFTANVIAAHVNGTSATFTAKVTSSTYVWLVPSDTITWTVYDNGEGGTGTADSFTYDGSVHLGVTDPGTGSTQYPATAGNIQVH
jgi:polyisoprenoid-binding protein YceI